jgi:hypothetical protein
MTLDEFAEWCQRTAIGHSLRSVVWEHPVVEILHYGGMVLLFGPVLIVNLRLLGLVLRGVAVADVADGVARWRNSGLFVLFATGPLLFLANAEKVFQGWFFPVKMTLLVIALILQFRVHERVTHAAAGAVSAGKAKVVAVASIAVWLGVALGGMGIGLFD